jgi:hypothetical protein
MKKNVVLIVFVVVVLGAASFIGMQYLPGPAPTDTVSAPAPLPEPAPLVAVPAPTPAPPVVEPAPAPAAVDPAVVDSSSATPEEGQAAAVPAEAALTAETLVGTEWQVGMFTLAFNEGGVVLATMGGSETKGTWVVEGDTLSVTGGGNTVTAKIVGDKLMAGNNPLPRIK